MNIRIDSEVEKFIYSLEKQTIAKILRAIDLLETFGHQLAMPHSKKVSRELLELRIKGQQEIRIFYCFHKGNIYLLNGFVKKSQKLPIKELEKAQNKYHVLT